MRGLIAFLLFAAIGAAQQSSRGDIDTAIAAEMQRHKVPGASVAVIRGGKVAWTAGYGVVEAGGAQRVNDQTVFQAASLSKAVAAFAALHMSQYGNFGLDEDLRVKFTGWKPPESNSAPNGFTLRQLASHTAGFTVSGFPGYRAGAAVPSLEQVLNGESPANTKPVVIDIPPGSQARYSGGGFTVMQSLMMDRLKRPFPGIMQMIVLKPLKMTRSTFEQPLPEAWAANAARAHDKNGKPIPGRWHTYPEMAAAGLWTTPGDYALFLIELWRAQRGESDRVVNRQSANEMVTPALGENGLGVMVRGVGARRRIRHGGSNAGFRCFFSLTLSSGDGAVVMTNSDNGAAMFDKIAAMLKVQLR
jgi:CubicO group peptidase (beta-lactamase class C family)